MKRSGAKPSELLKNWDVRGKWDPSKTMTFERPSATKRIAMDLAEFVKKPKFVQWGGIAGHDSAIGSAIGGLWQKPGSESENIYNQSDWRGTTPIMKKPGWVKVDDGKKKKKAKATKTKRATKQKKETKK